MPPRACDVVNDQNVRSPMGPLWLAMLLKKTPLRAFKKYGLKPRADAWLVARDVRFTPESGHLR
jgi:hypothetical protein